MDLRLVYLLINSELTLLLEVKDLSLLGLLDINLIQLLSHHLYVGLD